MFTNYVNQLFSPGTNVGEVGFWEYFFFFKTPPHSRNFSLCSSLFIAQFVLQNIIIFATIVNYYSLMYNRYLILLLLYNIHRHDKQTFEKFEWYFYIYFYAATFLYMQNYCDRDVFTATLLSAAFRQITVKLIIYSSLYSKYIHRVQIYRLHFF